MNDSPPDKTRQDQLPLTDNALGEVVRTFTNRSVPDDKILKTPEAKLVRFYDHFLFHKWACENPEAFASGRLNCGNIYGDQKHYDWAIEKCGLLESLKAEPKLTPFRFLCKTFPEVPEEDVCILLGKCTVRHKLVRKNPGPAAGPETPPIGEAGRL